MELELPVPKIVRTSSLLLGPVKVPNDSTLIRQTNYDITKYFAGIHSRQWFMGVSSARQLFARESKHFEDIDVQKCDFKKDFWETAAE